MDDEHPAPQNRPVTETEEAQDRGDGAVTLPEGDPGMDGLLRR